jgi:CBS domain containing-hemolysin-like protein
MGMSKFILKNIARVEFAEEKPLFGRVDLDFYIRDIATKNSQEEEINTGMDIFQNALDFTEVKVRECMVPRIEIVAIQVEDSIGDLVKLFSETKHSRILVYRDSVDNIIGFVHSNEIFKRPADILSALLPITIVPEVMAAHELLQLFIDQRRTIAVVVDEFGGTSGVVTIEDIMEEIFGEISDEHDTDETTERQINDNEFILSGRSEIDALNKKYDLDIPVGEGYETLAGFIVHHHENIPEPKEEIIIPPFTFTIIQIKENRIEQVRMKRDREK